MAAEPQACPAPDPGLWAGESTAQAWAALTPTPAGPGRLFPFRAPPSGLSGAGKLAGKG